MSLQIRIVEKGGPGSGFHGHHGRPGQIGGSSSNGNIPVADRPSALRNPKLPDLGGIMAASGNYGRARLQSFSSDFMDKTLLNAYNVASQMENSPYRIGTPEEGFELYQNTTDINASELKDVVVTTLSQDTGLPYDGVNMAIRQWAVTSNDEDMRSLSLQEAISEEFGYNLSEWQTKHIAKQRADYELWLDANKFAKERGYSDLTQMINVSYRDQRVSLETDWRARHPEGGLNLIEFHTRAAYFRVERNEPLMDRENERKLVRQMYDNTQKSLEGLGYEPNDTILLFRGINLRYNEITPLGEGAEYFGNAAESWSIHPRTAFGFGGVMLAAAVPVKNVLALPLTGFGCLTEGEVVVLGNVPGSQVEVIYDGS